MALSPEVQGEADPETDGKLEHFEKMVTVGSRAASAGTRLSRSIEARLKGKSISKSIIFTPKVSTVSSLWDF